MNSTKISTLETPILNLSPEHLNYSNKISIFIETNTYIVKTADKLHEIQSALRLRHDIFFSEGLGKTLRFELDIDKYDLDSDHLIVIDKTTHKIVGNYRLRCSAFHSNFYSESEFIMDRFLESTEETKVEIGRACIHPAYRSGAVIQLLWRGILSYMRKTDARYLFGCSSISTTIEGQIEYVWDHLRENSLINALFQVEPIIPYNLRNISKNSSNVDGNEKNAIPTLFQYYLNSGAKVLGPPAFDADFECADFFTLLDLHELSIKRSKRFKSSLRPVPS